MPASMILPFLIMLTAMTAIHVPPGAQAPIHQDLRGDVNGASLPSKDILSIALSNGAVWAGTAAGIVSRSAEGGQWTVRSHAVAAHLVPDGTANYLPVEGLGYDPARARQLLAEAGNCRARAGS